MIFDTIEGVAIDETEWEPIPSGPDTDDAYIEWLKHPRGGTYHFVVATGDGRWVGLLPLLFHWTMHVGKLTDRCGHSDRYCYRDSTLAFDSLTEWIMRGFEGEPNNWHRQPYKGLRREGGDPTKETYDP